MDERRKILIDLRGIQTESLYRGIGTLWKYILKYLAGIDRKNRYFLLYFRNVPSADDSIDYPDNFEKVYVGQFAGNRKVLFPVLWWYNNAQLGKFVRKINPDVIIYTTFPEVTFWEKSYSGCITINYIYDVIPVLFSRNPVKRYVMRRKLIYSSRNHFVIVLSKSVLEDINSVYSSGVNGVFVNYPGVDEHFFDFNSADCRNCAEKYNLPGRYILYVGGFDPRKNLTRLVEAYRIASERIELPPLVVAGKTGGNYYEALVNTIRRYNLTEKIIFPGYIDDNCMPCLYFMADFLAFPSLYEGFGLPVVESMASGCPVLTSNVSSMPEIAGDCAVLVDPYDVNSIADAIISLSTDDNLRRRLSACGREHARKFPWRRTAERLLEIIETVSAKEK